MRWLDQMKPVIAQFLFLLKNRMKEVWRDRHQQELTGKDGGKIELTVVDMSKKDEKGEDRE